jgi:hypothetical protein
MRICTDCFPTSELIGHTTPDIAYATLGGLHVIITAPGHTGDIIGTFSQAPTPDPLEDLDDDATCDDSDAAAADAWADAADASLNDLAEHLGPVGCWSFINDLIEHAGYDPTSDGYVHMWLYDRCGQLAHSQP